ncbi:hypothetical protein H9Q13_13460 [Pontibacter sp. JH31]|uniref:Uncharacterized protein n=1 Tax=Pontibacter aquaedesilientis TaxID=2766980 RepID=A0ABR7XJR3_9BACT|nr:hypothetical protein [Pontibacter aquaedesilientis]MBD1398176.1 hypothetical protein [Pontibacter aquaedesilientis]
MTNILYIESIDQSLNRYNNAIAADKVVLQVAGKCLEFTHDVGYTRTAAELRVADSAAGEIDGNSSCVVKGTDTSCLTENHVCYSTTTLECDC